MMESLTEVHFTEKFGSSYLVGEVTDVREGEEIKDGPLVETPIVTDRSEGLVWLPHKMKGAPPCIGYCRIDFFYYSESD